MKVIQQYCEWAQQPPPDTLRIIERAGRTCYKSEDRITPESAAKFVRKILASGHESVIEHVSASMRFVRLLKFSWTPQQARTVLPNSLKTEIVMTANLREWRHFFRLRTAKTAHPQMQDIASKALAMFKAAVPVLFDDIP